MSDFVIIGSSQARGLKLFLAHCDRGFILTVFKRAFVGIAAFTESEPRLASIETES